MAGYNWILSPASIFVGHYLKEFCVKFESILQDSLSLVKILEKEKFDTDCFLFTVIFESLYSNIPVEYAMELMKALVFEYRDVISNADFIINLLELVLENSLMEFHGEYFQQFFGIIIYFRRYIDDRFGITKGSKSDVEYWITEINNLVQSINIH